MPLLNAVQPFPCIACSNRLLSPCFSFAEHRLFPTQLKVSCSHARLTNKVLNAAMLYWPMSNVLYVEGYALDRFAEGAWSLLPVHQNRVGLVLDAGMEEELRVRHLQVADATRASLGLPVIEYIVTDTPLEFEKWVDPMSGQSTGRMKHPDSLRRAVSALVNQSRVNVVVVVARFPDDNSSEDVNDYGQGKGIDLLAGVEAVISPMVVKEFEIPCAHAPALPPMSLTTSVSPKSAAEEIEYTFLPCVLAGLSSAPQYLKAANNYVDSGPLMLQKDCLMVIDVDSVILPADACGGDRALAFAATFSKRTKTSKGVEPIMSFDEMGIKDNLLRGIYNYGFEKPSAIQQRAVLPIIQSRDVIAQAQSGTGKTSMIVLTVCQIVDTSSSEVQALIVSPTRELAAQTEKVILAIGDNIQVRMETRLLQNENLCYTTIPIKGIYMD